MWRSAPTGEIEVGKPDPKAFRAALDAIDARAEHTVFVDDFPENVDAARRLGMHAVLCTDSQQTATELGALLR
jgi:putative hydrolase of the HAD superfamily